MNKKLIPGILNEIKKGTLTREIAAKRLGVCTRTINRYMNKAGISRPEPEYLKRRKIAETRKAFKDQARGKAMDIPLEALMKLAGISKRTAYRWKNGQ